MRRWPGPRHTVSSNLIIATIICKYLVSNPGPELCSLSSCSLHLGVACLLRSLFLFLLKVFQLLVILLL